MWKQITKEQIKDYPVGTKVRIGGYENVIKHHYNEYDYGFGLEQSKVVLSGTSIFAHGDWSRGVTVEVWEEPLTSLKGIYVDTTDLDEDTCKRLVDAFVSQGYKDSTQNGWGRGIDDNYHLQIDTTDDDDLCYFSGDYGRREVTPKQVFDFVSKNSPKVSEDDNVEKLNDLINKYFAKNTTLSLAEFLDGRGVKA